MNAFIDELVITRAGRPDIRGHRGWAAQPAGPGVGQSRSQRGGRGAVDRVGVMPLRPSGRSCGAGRSAGGRSGVAGIGRSVFADRGTTAGCGGWRWGGARRCATFGLGRCPPPASGHSVHPRLVCRADLPRRCGAVCADRRRTPASWSWLSDS